MLICASTTIGPTENVLAAQTGATLAAIRPQRVAAIVGSSLLGLTAAVAGISGFYDGQLGRADLSRVYVAAQIGYVVVAWLAVAAAGVRLRQTAQKSPAGLELISAIGAPLLGSASTTPDVPRVIRR